MYKLDEECKIRPKQRQKDFFDTRFSDIEHGLVKLKELTFLYDLNLVKRILVDANISIMVEVCAGQSTDAIWHPGCTILINLKNL